MLTRVKFKKKIPVNREHRYRGGGELPGNKGSGNIGTGDHHADPDSIALTWWSSGEMSIILSAKVAWASRDMSGPVKSRIILINGGSR